jgi:hypothetical protein
MAYGSSLISAVYIIGFRIAAIGVDFVYTCETIALTLKCDQKLPKSTLCSVAKPKIPVVFLQIGAYSSLQSSLVSYR